MKKSIIVAQSTNSAIGYAGKLPWHLPSDLNYFKKTTYGHPIIMGRVTFESIGKPLPGRLNIILTKRINYVIPYGCMLASNLDLAWYYAEQFGTGEVFVIGGQNIYKQALPVVDKVYMTQIHAHVPGDTFFPALSHDCWREVSRQDFPPDDKNHYAYAFITYVRA